MRTHTQIRPLGNDPATDHARQQQSRASEELQLYDSEDIVFKRTTNGIRAYLKRKFFGGNSFSLRLYSQSTAFAPGNYAWVQATDTLITTGATYPPTGLTALSKAGLWLCVRPAAAGIFPVLPYPTPDDPTAANMFWLYLGNVYCA